MIIRLYAFQNLQPPANRCAVRSSTFKIQLNGKGDICLVARRELLVYVTLQILRFAYVEAEF